jgi:hypothetical protein
MLVLSLPFAFMVRTNIMMDMFIVISTGQIGLIVLVVLLEIVYSKQIVEDKMDNLLFPIGLMILAVLIELAFAISLRYVDGLILGIHVSFVIGLSAIEAGLMVIEYTRESP